VPLSVGIIGLKGHQGVALNAIPNLPDVRLAAVCDDDEAALAGVRHWPSAHEHTQTYTNWGQMLEREKLDLVVEAGTDDQRAGILVECLKRGLHVLAEKPLVKELADLARVHEAWHGSGRQLSMLLTMRFEPAYRAMKEIIATGAIGAVCQAGVQKSYRLGQRPAWQRDRRTFSGIIPFIGTHALDLIRFTTGREFTQVMAYQGNTGHPEIGDMEDHACLALRLDNGGSAAARLDYCRPAAAPTHGDDRLRIAGSKGVIESLACGQTVTLITQEEGPREIKLGPPADQFANFVAAVRGEGQCEAPAEDCFRMTEVVLKAREAARTGVPAAL
jgi:predicted dehydrogenase